MNISDNLVEELKNYLNQQADNGSLEAQNLLAKLEKVANESQENSLREKLFPSREQGLGC